MPYNDLINNNIEILSNIYCNISTPDLLRPAK